MDPDFISDLKVFLEDQADAEYGTEYNSARPNWAMKLLTRLQELFPATPPEGVYVDPAKFFPPDFKAAPDIANVVIKGDGS